MDARRPCPDAALLAAFLDNTLAEYERTAVVSHLSECAQCRSIAATVIEFREVETLDELWRSEPSPTEAPGTITRVDRWAGEKTRAPAWHWLGAAIVVVLALFLPSHNAADSPQQALSRMLVASAGQQAVEARLAGDPSSVVFKQQSDPRGASSSLVLVAERVRDNYANGYDVTSRRAIGVAALMTHDLDSAVASLSIAASAAPDDSRVANDLAAAYFERAQRLDRPEDLPAALSEVERALHLDPQSLQARFNRGLIISALGLADEAQAAWREYLVHDPSSSWALEARQRLGAIEVALTGEEWEALRQTVSSSADPDSAVNAVERGGSRVREWFEDTLLREWTLQTSSAAAQPLVRRMRVIADALEARTGDRFFVDVVKTLGQSRHETAAAAHRDLLLGISRMRARDFQGGERVLRRALPQLQRIGSPAALAASVEIATSAYGQKDYDNAARMFAVLREEARRRQYLHLAARASWMEGLAHFSRNDLAAARVAYEEMLAFANTTGDPEHSTMANGLLAALHVLQGNNHDAWRHLVNALRRLHTCHVPVTHINVLLTAGGQAMASGHFAAALLFQTRLLQSGLALPAVAQTQVRTQRATALAHLDRLAAAAADIEEARALLPDVTDRQWRAGVEADLSAANAEVVQRQDPVEALRIAERGLAAVAPLNDMFRQGRLLLRVADAALATGNLARADEAVTAGIAALHSYRTTSETQSASASDFELPLYGKAIQVALKRDDVPRAFEYSERRRTRIAMDGSGRAIPSLREVQRSLGPDTAIVVVNQLDEVLHVWTIKRDGLTTYETAIERSRVAGLVLAHLDEVARGTSRPLTSGALYELIFRPISPQLRGMQTVALMVDAPFSHVAFPGLWDARRDRFLVEDFRLVSADAFTPASRDAAATRPDRVTERFGIVQVSENAPYGQPRRDVFTTDVSKLYANTEVRRGDAATPSRILRQLSERDVMHVAAPVTGDAGNPATWRIVLADEPGDKYSGSLSLIDLARTNVRTKLVTFDPDGSERGTTGLDGTQSVARALAAAGVADVVGPVVTMPAATYGELWLEFHREYTTGWSAVDSLRRAQLNALVLSNRRTGPWAALTVFSTTQ